MKKESKMIMLKKEGVKNRSKLIEKACVSCLDNNIDITYRIISEETDIPSSTLKRIPYKDIISSYRNVNKNEQVLDSKILAFREQIRYLQDVIKQLNKENHELKTKLLNEGKI